jgi:hypothetical protein
MVFVARMAGCAFKFLCLYMVVLQCKSTACSVDHDSSETQVPPLPLARMLCADLVKLAGDRFTYCLPESHTAEKTESNKYAPRILEF